LRSSAEAEPAARAKGAAGLALGSRRGLDQPTACMQLPASITIRAHASASELGS
jgi:hypothetical protein